MCLVSQLTEKSVQNNCDDEKTIKKVHKQTSAKSWTNC